MACQWIWSPDHIGTGDLDRELGLADNGVTVSTTNNRYGTKNMRFTGGIGVDGEALKFLPGSYSEFYFGVAVRWENNSDQDSWNIAFYEDSTKHLSWRLNYTTNLIEVLGPAGTVIATGTTVFLENEWHFFEFYIKIANSGGRVIVKVDQRFSSTDYEIDYTGDTQNGGSGVVNRLNLLSSNSGSVMRLTDFYLNDTSGDENNSWMGDMTVATLFPNGAGDDTDFTPNPAVANYLNVDDSTSTDGDATYNESPNEVDTRDLYALSDTSVEVQAIFAVQVSVIARKQPAGPRGLRSLIKSGTTTSEGADHILLDEYTTEETVYDVDPDTGDPWDKSGVDSLQAGAKVQY